MIDTRIVEVLAGIEQSLKVIAGALAKAPNIQKPITDYPDFDWASIGARLLRRDADGASVVEHNGRIYKRRSPDNKYEACIWFSRCTGKDSDGTNHYETLISFEFVRDDVEPLGQKARKALPARNRSTTPQPANGNDVTQFAARPLSENVTPFVARPLTEAEMQGRAERFVTEKRVSYASKTYTVQVNDNIAHKVTEGPVCTCERFKTEAKTNPKFRCEHIRAVALFASSKPDSRNELKLLIADLQSAGMDDETIDNSIARVCDGMFAVEELSVEQVAKAIRALQGKLVDLNVRARREAA